MKKIMTAAIVATLALGVATTAKAITILGGTAGVIPGMTQSSTPENNVLEALGLGPSLGGFYGATIDAGSASKLKIDLIGSEAGNRNTFTFQGTELFTGGQNGGSKFNAATDVGNPLSSTIVSSLGGVLDFVFTSMNRSGASASIANGANPDGNPLSNSAPAPMNFFASFGPGAEDSRTGKALWLFLDDFGQTTDSDHDDLVIRISVVPLPAGALLLISGLGVMALRRKRAA